MKNKIILLVSILFVAKMASSQELPTHVEGLNLAKQNWHIMDFERTINILDNSTSELIPSSNSLAQSALYRYRMGMYSEADLQLRQLNNYNPHAIDLFGINGYNGIMKVIKADPKKDFIGLRFDTKLAYYNELIDEQFVERGYTDQELEVIEDIILNIKQGFYDSALEAIEQDRSLYGNSAILFDLQGLILFKLGDFEKSKIALQEAVRLKPDFGIAWYNLGQVEKTLGNHNLAEEYFKKAIDVEEDLVKAKFDLALVKKELNKTDEAIDLYDEIIDKNHNEALEAIVNRGLTKKLLGNFTEAHIDLNRAIEMDENNPILYFNRANLQMIYEDNEAAIRDYDIAIKLDPYFASAYFNRGLAKVKISKHSDACRDLQESKNLGLEFDPKFFLFCADR